MHIDMELIINRTLIGLLINSYSMLYYFFL